MIRVFDFETSGLDPDDGAEVCELGYSDLLPDGTITPSVSRLFGIRTKMPPEVRAVHHIRDEDLEGLPPFDAGDLGAAEAYAAHNAAFELQFITPSAPVICTYKAAMHVWPDAPSHGNFALAYWLEDQGILNRIEAQPAHRAGPDAFVTAHVLTVLLKHATVDEMVQWASEPRPMPTIPIGKYKGQPWSAADHGYLNWMVRQDDMDGDIVFYAQRELAVR